METPTQSPEVIFKFYTDHNREELNIHLRAMDMFCLLHDIKEKCRGVWKYEEGNEGREDLAEEISTMIHEAIDLDSLG